MIPARRSWSAARWPFPPQGRLGRRAVIYQPALVRPAVVGAAENELQVERHFRLALP